jgi:hypothetical protein
LDASSYGRCGLGVFNVERVEKRMTENEKAMYEALTAIARRDCAGYCGLIARKTIERIEQADIDLNRTKEK